MTTITIEVEEQVAQSFFQVSDEERQKFQILLNSFLKELILNPNKSLMNIMDEIGNYSESKGMTQELLSSLLNEK